MRRNTGRPTQDRTVEQEITQIEGRRIEAMKQADAAALGQILADDLTYMHSSGRPDTKASFIASLQSGELKYEAMDFSDVKVRGYGDTAVVTGHASVRVNSKGQALSFPIRYTDVYVKKDGRWQMVAWHAVRPPQQ